MGGKRRRLPFSALLSEVAVRATSRSSPGSNNWEPDNIPEPALKCRARGGKKMRFLKYIALLAVLGVVLMPAAKSSAQVSVGVGIGAPAYGPGISALWLSACLPLWLLQLRTLLLRALRILWAGLVHKRTLYRRRTLVRLGLSWLGLGSRRLVVGSWRLLWCAPGRWLSRRLRRRRPWIRWWSSRLCRWNSRLRRRRCPRILRRCDPRILRRRCPLLRWRRRIPRWWRLPWWRRGAMAADIAKPNKVADGYPSG